MATQTKIRITIFVLAILYASSMSAFSIVQHYGLKTQMNDLGNMDQAIWAASKGDWSMHQSNCEDGAIRSRFGRHANLIFWVLVPLYWLWPHPEILLTLTSCACAIAGVGLYFFTRSKIGNSWWAVIPSISFWLSPMVQQANLYDFHVLTLAAAFFVWMLWAFDTGRIKTGWILLIPAILCQENIPLVMIFYGIYLLLTHRYPLGLQVLLISVLYLIFLDKFFVPFFTHGNGLWASPINHYTWLGAKLSDLPANFIHQLPQVVSQVFRPDRLRVVLYFLLSGAIVAFRSWKMLLLLVPVLLESLLSNTIFTTRITGTYFWVVPEAIIIAAVVLAAQGSTKTIRKIILLYLLGATVFFSWAFSPLPYGMGSSWDDYALNKNEYRTLKEIRKLIPSNASISIQNNLGPHFSHRKDIAAFPSRMETAQYVILHLRYIFGKDSGYFYRNSYQIVIPTGSREALHDFLISGAANWRSIFHRDGYYVFVRGQSSPQEWQNIGRSIENDASVFKAQAIKAWSGYSKWTSYLNSDVSWTEL